MPVEFGDLPLGPPSSRGAWQPVADQLRKRPGEWARITTKETAPKARNLARSIRSGAIVAFRPHEHFEAVARGNDVWARYIGGES
jgi:hypothetical protein